MNRRQKILVGVLVVCGAMFVPFWKVVVVPEWPITVVDESGESKPGIEVRQYWNHYSFDGSGISGFYGGQETGTSDANGVIVFPERSFRASLFGVAFAYVGTPLRWINPHASSGPHSYFICPRESCSDTKWYRGNQSELENSVLTIESEETIQKRLDETMERLQQDLGGLPAGESEGGAPPLPPLRKKDANR
jgi:hypothetical protein